MDAIEPNRAEADDGRNGRVLLRLPKFIHRALVDRAAAEGVSVNQFLLASIAQTLGGEPSAYQLRTKVIQELYTKIVEAERAWTSLLSPGSIGGGPTEKEKAATAIAAANDFRDAFFHYRIHFPRPVVEQLHKIDEIVQQAYITYFVYGRKETTEDHKALFNTWSTMNSNVAHIRAGLEVEFRKMLGVFGDDTQDRKSTAAV
jgi:hypothetical protein